MTKLRAALVGLTATAIAMAAGSSAAHGAFPGNSGKIAFVNDRNGTPSIFTMNADGSGIKRMVGSQPQGAFPSWSPNRRDILFSVRVSDQPGPAYELWTMKANGTEIHRFLPGRSRRPMASTWSPDGTKIAFYEDGYLWLTDAKHVFTRRLVRADFADAAPSWSRRGRIAFDRGGGIWTTNVRGTVVRRLKNGGEPSWSPDGRRVAFSATPPGGENNDIYVMRADGSGRHRLTATKAANEGQPSWSPNGRWISYSGKKGIYLIRSNGTKNRLFIEKGRQAGWSPGSNALVFAQRTPAWDGLIFRIDLNGKNKRQLLKPKVDAGPMWSPNGDRLAFTRGGIVNVVNANDRTSVHSIGLRGSDPAWSPDGSLIVVGSGSQLEVSNSDGSGSATIPLELDYESYVRVSEPDWSPDGSKIAFVATEASGTRDLFLVSPTGSSPTRIPVGCGSLGATSPSWSPDGNWLVFNCEGSIAIAHPDGSLLTPLTSGQNATIAWSPDGSQIAFSEQTDEEPAQLFVVNADGSVRQQLTTGPGASDEPDWQPHP